MIKSNNQILTEKSICLLQRNQYTFDVDSELTKTEMKDWVEKFFNVKVKGINSCRVPNRNKIKRSSELGFSSRASHKKMIVRLRDNCSIPLFLN
uniref:Large ribosomal subunit protein uL23c n=1 Tax=Saccoloma inaequale TaxID=262953 RepID=A0A5B9RDB9_9MONI|nr:ribosomal protein L23 [Saccoloma inaequale]QEG57834.1 ribosomal protein L23 [Saccoloma inaequale]